MGHVRRPLKLHLRLEPRLAQRRYDEAHREEMDVEMERLLQEPLHVEDVVANVEREQGGRAEPQHSPELGERAREPGRWDVNVGVEGDHAGERRVREVEGREIALAERDAPVTMQLAGDIDHPR